MRIGCFIKLFVKKGISLEILVLGQIALNQALLKKNFPIDLFFPCIVGL